MRRTLGTIPAPTIPEAARKQRRKTMETERIQLAVEDALIKMIRSGDAFKIDYNNKIDCGAEFRKAYAAIDFKRVYSRISELLEEELAQKIVNKIITEMGTDIKNLMSNATVRDDLRFLMRKGVEAITEKVKDRAAESGAEPVQCLTNKGQNTGSPVGSKE